MFAEMEKGGRSPVYEHVERIRLISELASGAGFWGGGVLTKHWPGDRAGQQPKELVDFIRLNWRLHR